MKNTWRDNNAWFGTRSYLPPSVIPSRDPPLSLSKISPIKTSSHAEPIISRAEEPYQDTCGSVNPPRHRTYEFTLGFARQSQPLPDERRGADACATCSNGFPSHRLLASWENLEITCMSGEVTWHQPFRCFPKDSVYDAKVQTWQKFVTFFLWNF